MRAAQSSLVRGGHPRIGRERIPPGFWDTPLSNAVEITAVAAAALPYAINEPDGLGAAKRVLTSDPAAEPEAFREIAWVYDHPVFGRFIVRERAVNLTGAQASIEELLGAKPGCVSPGEGGAIEDCHYGERSRISLPGGQTGVLFVGDVTTFVQWVEPAIVLDSAAFAPYRGDFPQIGLLVEILGPAGDFTPEEAQTVAALV